MRSSAPYFYKFGRFQIDLAERSLLRNGERVPLTPKAFDTLLILVESNGKVFEKDELMKLIWGETHVEENNLSQNIHALRKALGDDPENPHYIKTLPRLGYRFVAEVEKVHEEKNAIEPAAGANNPRIVNFAGRRMIIGALLTVLLIGAVTWFVYRVPKDIRAIEDRFREMRISRVSAVGKAWEAAISPDGQFVAYASGEGGRQTLLIKHLATSRETVLIPHAEVTYRGVTFSHDSMKVFYTRREKSGSDHVLHETPISGGGPKRLLSGVDSPVTFSPEGSQIAFVRENPTQGESSLMIANADGSGERRLTTRRSPEFYSVDGPAWSRDGKLIASAVASSDGRLHYRIMVARVADGVERRVGDQNWEWAMKVAWLSDDSGLVILARAVKVGPNNQVWLLKYPEGSSRRITNDLNDYRGLNLTADSKSLVTVQAETRSNIWIVPSGKPNSAYQITNDSASQNGRNGLDWTPDNKIIYSSKASGRDGIWSINRDGSQSGLITAYPGDDQHFPAVSGDGRYIVFVSSRSGPPRIWRVDIDGGNPKELTNGNLDLRPSCSPDGQWVVYSSERSGRRSIWRISKAGIDGGEPLQLTDKLTDYPVVSPDGKLIVCVYQEATGLPRKIALIPFDGGAPVKYLDIPVFHRPTVGWHPSGRALSYINPQDDSLNVWLQPLSGDAPTRATEFEGERIFAYAWSRDGRYLAVARGVINRDVVMISNFR